MSKRLNKIQLLLAAGLALSITACDNAVFNSEEGSDLVGFAGPGDTGVIRENGDLVFIDDSFEREDIFGDLDAGFIVGWRGAFDDNGTIGTGFTGNQLGMETVLDTDLGPAADQNRSVLFYGRTDADIHRLWLVSPVYDLSTYNTVILSYRHLTIALNDQEDIDANYIEQIRLQVCAGSSNECGANADFIDVAAIGNDGNWVTLDESDPAEDDDSRDGTNHLATDFTTGLAVIDLNNTDFVADKSEFIFRFEVDLRDGFALASPGGDYDAEKCEKYKKKKKYYCDKAEYKCNKADEYGVKCESDKAEHDSHKRKSDGYSLLTAHRDQGKKKHCNHSHNCKKERIYDYYCGEYTKKCERYKEKVEKYCNQEPPTPAEGLVDGVLLDLVQGIATERDISEIF